MKELVELIGKESVQQLLTWLDKKTTFVIFDIRGQRKYLFLISDDLEIITKPEHGYKSGILFNDLFCNMLGFATIYYQTYVGDAAVYHRYDSTPFDAKPYLEQLNNL